MQILKNYHLKNFKAVLKQALSKLNKSAKAASIILLRMYQAMLSPVFGGRCRFEPSCSCYGIEAFQKHAFFRALFLTAKRFSKCHPAGPYGYDPLPEKNHD